jgi:putative aldouronate transport system substrate-binding protein
VGGQKIIPFSGDPVNMNLGQFAGWFGQPAAIGNRNGGGVAVVNGQLEITITRNEYRQFIKYFADLAKEGLIDPELFTQDQATWKAKGKMGLYGVSIAYGPGDFENELHTDVTNPRFSYTAVPVLKGPGVTKPIYRRNGYGMTIFRTQFAITDKANNPEVIVKWLDYVYDKVHSAEAQWGKLGVSVEEVNGKMHEIDRTNWSQSLKETWSWGNFWFGSLPKYLRDGKIYPPANRAPEYNYNDLVDALYEPYLEQTPAPQLWIAGTDAQRVADITTAIESYVRQKQAEWITGQANIDAEWDAYLAQLNRLGIDELLKIKRAAMVR